MPNNYYVTAQLYQEMVNILNFMQINILFAKKKQIVQQ